MLYGRPFVYVNDLFLDPEAQTLWSYTMATGQFQQDICLWGVNQDPKDSKEPPLYAPGTQVLIRVWKNGSSKAQLQPTWKDHYPVILSSLTTVKVPEYETQIHYSWVKPWEKTEEDSQYTVSPWQVSDTYPGLQMSAILMNTPKIKFLRKRFLRSALKSQHSLVGVVLQNRQEIDLLILEQEGPEPSWMKHVFFWVNISGEVKESLRVFKKNIQALQDHKEWAGEFLEVATALLGDPSPGEGKFGLG